MGEKYRAYSIGEKWGQLFAQPEEALVRFRNRQQQDMKIYIMENELDGCVDRRFGGAYYVYLRSDNRGTKHLWNFICSLFYHAFSETKII
jgi:hypothetical protein